MLASARGRAWRRTAASTLPLVPGRNVGRAFTPAAWGSAPPQGFRDDASIVPYETRGKALPGFAGYFRRKAAMHPSVCAFRRIHLPLQGRLCKRFPPKRLPCKGLRSRAPPAADTARRSRCSGRRTQVCFSTRSAMRAPQTGNVGVSRLRGAAPCPANTLPGRRKLPRSCGITGRLHKTAASPRRKPPRRAKSPALQCKANGRHNRGRQAWRVDDSRGVPSPCVGADARIGPPSGLAADCRFRAAARSRPQCRAGVHARREGLAVSQGFRDDTSIVPSPILAAGCRFRVAARSRPPCNTRQAAPPGQALL